MILILLFVSAISASQVTRYSIDYGTYTVPATMVEDGNITAFSSSSDAGMEDVIVDYNTKQVVLKSDRRKSCSVAEINDVVQQRIEKYRQQIHQTQVLQALYFTLQTRKPSGQTASQRQMIQELCPDYHVDFVRFLSAGNTPPRLRHSCWGVSWGKHCYGITGKRFYRHM